MFAVLLYFKELPVVVHLSLSFISFKFVPFDIVLICTVVKNPQVDYV